MITWKPGDRKDTAGVPYSVHATKPWGLLPSNLEPHDNQVAGRYPLCNSRYPHAITSQKDEVTCTVCLRKLGYSLLEALDIRDRAWSRN